MHFLQFFTGRNRTTRDPLTRVFSARELRELDAHLERIALAELQRIDAEVTRYLAGLAGHIVGVVESRDGVALGLSDGHRLAVGALSRTSLRTLRRHAAGTRLVPAQVDREGFAYRLLLRSETGAELALRTRRLALST